MIADRVARRFASQQTVNLVRDRQTWETFYGYEDYTASWRDAKRGLAKYCRALETWAPIYRRIASALMTPQITDYADLMSARVREVNEALPLGERLMQEARQLDRALLELAIPDKATDEQLQELVTSLPAYHEALETALKLEATYERWAAEDRGRLIDTSLEDYVLAGAGKLQTRLDHGAIPHAINDDVDLATVAFGYLQGMLDPETIAEYKLADQVRLESLAGFLHQIGERLDLTLLVARPSS